MQVDLSRNCNFVIQKNGDLFLYSNLKFSVIFQHLKRTSCSTAGELIERRRSRIHYNVSREGDLRVDNIPLLYFISSPLSFLGSALVSFSDLPCCNVKGKCYEDRDEMYCWSRMIKFNSWFFLIFVHFISNNFPFKSYPNSILNIINMTINPSWLIFRWLFLF